MGGSNGTLSEIACAARPMASSTASSNGWLSFDGGIWYFRKKYQLPRLGVCFLYSEKSSPLREMPISVRPAQRNIRRETPPVGRAGIVLGGLFKSD